METSTATKDFDRVVLNPGTFVRLELPNGAIFEGTVEFDHDFRVVLNGCYMEMDLTDEIPGTEAVIDLEAGQKIIKTDADEGIYGEIMMVKSNPRPNGKIEIGVKRSL